VLLSTILKKHAICDTPIRALCIRLAHINTFPSVGGPDEQASHGEIDLKNMIPINLRIMCRFAGYYALSHLFRGV
jgi:hypothetical protein